MFQGAEGGAAAVEDGQHGRRHAAQGQLAALHVHIVAVELGFVLIETAVAEDRLAGHVCACPDVVALIVVDLAAREDCQARCEDSSAVCGLVLVDLSRYRANASR